MKSACVGVLSIIRRVKFAVFVVYFGSIFYPVLWQVRRPYSSVMW